MKGSSRKIFLFSIFLTLLSIAINYFSFQVGRNISERHTPLINASSKIILETTSAHLWFEEIMSGDEAVQIKEVWQHLDRAQWYAQAMLDGASNDESVFIPLKSPKLRMQIKETIAGIEQFRQIAQHRWSSKLTSGIGSESDQQFDIAFHELTALAESVRLAIEEEITKDLATFKNTQRLLVIFILLLGLSLTYLFLRYNARQTLNLNALTLKEEQVRKSEQQLQNIINGAKLGYWDWNYRTGEQYVNDEWLLMLGLTRQDICNNINDWEKRVHPQDKAFIYKAVQNYLKSGENYVAEFRMKHADGRWIWIKGSGAVVEFNEETNEPVRLCGTHTDITKSKLVALREKSRFKVLELINSNEQLSEILNAIVLSVEEEHSSMLCSILLLDESGEHLLTGAAPNLPEFYNEAIHGVKIGKGVGSCGVAAFTNKRVIVNDIETHPNWAPYKELAKNAGLGSCWSEPIRSTQGKVLGTFAIYHQHISKPSSEDITLIEQSASLASIAIEKIQANTALKARDEQMQLVLAGANLGYWDWDLATGKVERNERWATMLGYTYKEIQNTAVQWSDFIHPDDREKAWHSINEVLESRSTSHNLEYRMLTKKGEIKWIHDQANVMKRSIDGKLLRMSGTHSDITDRKISEEKIKLADYIILNDGKAPLVPQILKVHDRICALK